MQVPLVVTVGETRSRKLLPLFAAQGTAAVVRRLGACREFLRAVLRTLLFTAEWRKELPNDDVSVCYQKNEKICIINR